MAYSGHREGLWQHANDSQSVIQTNAHCHRPLSGVVSARSRKSVQTSNRCGVAMKRLFGWATVRHRALAKEYQLALRPLWLDQAAPGVAVIVGGGSADV